MRKKAILCLLAAAAAIPASVGAQNTNGRAGGEGMIRKPRDLDTHHLFVPPSARAAWEQRKTELRQQVLFSAGLWPMPKKTPLNPQITGRIDAPDYSIENVALETLPGFYLCGNLYRPKGRIGKVPGIVNPHGHWVNGRLEIEEDVPPAAPPPAPPAPGRGNLVSIGVNLARQGFVVFAYDAVGYNDTRQVDHKFANNLRPWLWNISEMGLQLWNSIRVVDYLQSLPQVDKDRIGATGASGGGSQTFLLTAVDDRIKAAVPVNMVSASMQGGCLCENGPGLRVGTDNPEIAALFAPKPLLLVACTGDWTKNNPQEEWPAIKRVYDLYGAGDRTAVKQFNYQHNYNVESREAMYAWFGKWLLGDGDRSHFKEKPFTADVAAMRVWNDRNPLPVSALGEAALTDSLINRSREQLTELWPTRPSSLPKFRAQMVPALQASLSARWRGPGGSAAKAGGPIALVVAEEPDEGQADKVVRAVRARGAGAEIFLVRPTRARAEDMWANYYSGYNQTPAGAQVQRILDKIAALWQENHSRVDVVGVGRAGRVCLLARALTPNIGGVVADVGQIDSRDDKEWLTDLYAPGIRRAGDLQTASMLIAPGRLYLHNTGGRFTAEPIVEGFGAVGTEVMADHLPAGADAIAAWLTTSDTRAQRE